MGSLKCFTPGLFGLATTLASPGAAGAQDATSFDGIYRQNTATTCADPGESEGALRIEDGVFFGAGAQCEMVDPVEIRDMSATLFDFVCERDDAAWSSRFFLSRAADGGLIVVSDGFAFKYDRCDPDDPVGVIMTAPTLGITNDVPAAGLEGN